MLKKYQNGFIEVIKKYGLQPELFSSYNEIKNNTEHFKISLLNTPLYFDIWNVKNDFHVFQCQNTCFDPEFSTSPIYATERQAFIDDVYQMFGYWIEEHVLDCINELNTPNLWSHIKNRNNIFSISTDSKEDFLKFTNKEKQELIIALGNFRTLLISMFSPTKEEIDSINKRLDYLEESFNRLNRFDWKSVLITTVISISISLSLDTEKGKVLWDILRTAFSNILLFK